MNRRALILINADAPIVGENAQAAFQFAVAVPNPNAYVIDGAKLVRAIAISDPVVTRGMIVAAAAAGALVGGGIVLWARYGGAAFQELVTAGATLCF